MIKIKFLSGQHSSKLVDADHSWLATPLGMPTKAGTGPAGARCLMCQNFILGESRWSTHGRAAPCAERRRLAPGKEAPPVPARWAACSRFTPRPGIDAAVAAADGRLDDRILERRAKIDTLRIAISRLESEIDELHEEQRDARGARPNCEDSGDDEEWRGFEPVGHENPGRGLNPRPGTSEDSNM
jgi:hypothetical protein